MAQRSFAFGGWGLYCGGILAQAKEARAIPI
jgi:hypothetical protein